MTPNTLTIYAHGAQRVTFNIEFGENKIISVLNRDSSMWRSYMKTGKSLSINLKSCYTGNTKLDYGWSIAHDLTKNRANLIIHAAVTGWKSTENVYGGYNMFMNGNVVGWDKKR
ncbi:hypothetical protein [Flavobacterium sp.]|uniref:hypothetical protein n=1 Tax=Flavobacterium sp. TaxID=239 RepID=UPI003752E835